MSGKVQTTKPYTAAQAVRALGRQIRGSSSGMAARAARTVSNRGRDIDRVVDEVQDRQIRRR